MPDVLHAALFQPELLPEEKLLWTGRADPNRHFSRADLYVFPFSAVVCGYFAYRLGKTVSECDASNIISLLLLVGTVTFLAVVAVYLFLGRFWVKRRVKLQSYYAITNMRVLAFKLGSVTRLNSRFRESTTNVRKEAREDGSGSLIIGEQAPIERFLANAGIEEVFGNSESSVIGLYDIDDVEVAYRIVDAKPETRSSSLE